MIDQNFNPLTNETKQSLMRECFLVRGLLRTGITALSKAGFNTNQEWYYVVFFNLSIGIERLAKLILIVDFTIINSNAFPKESIIRKHGHKIKQLLQDVIQISDNHSLKSSYSNEQHKISDAIICSLDSFAEADKGRYHNFKELGNNNANTKFEPIAKWRNEVDRLILEIHWDNTHTRKKSDNMAIKIASSMNDTVMCMLVDEDNHNMNVQDVLLRGYSNKTLVKFRIYYTLLIIRRMSNIFIQLSYKSTLDEFYGLYEFFHGFCLKDQYLKKGKTWPAF